MPAFLFCFIFISCSLFSKSDDDKKIEWGSYKKYENSDFSDHLSGYDKLFLNTPGVDVIKLSWSNKRYINGLIEKIRIANPIFFEKEEKVKIYFIKDNSPYHFSLPQRKIFISTGLFKKYVQNESLLMCLLTFELIRTEKKLYKKKITIPTGSMDAAKILPLLRLNAFEKTKIHKWAFRLLEKLNVDSDTYLSWLQIQNRNSIDFSMQLGDINVISREEALFKAFIIENSRGEIKREYKRSTKDFYVFLRDIRTKL